MVELVPTRPGRLSRRIASGLLAVGGSVAAFGRADDFSPRHIVV